MIRSAHRRLTTDTIGAGRRRQFLDPAQKRDALGEGLEHLVDIDMHHEEGAWRDREPALRAVGA